MAVNTLENTTAGWFYVGKEAMDKAFAKLKSTAEKVQDEMHRCACSALKHVIEHGDIVYVERFIDALPASSRSNAFKLWFETFGPVSFKDGLKYVKGGNKALASAVAMPAWKLKPEETYVPMDVAGAIDALVAKIKKDSKKSGKEYTAVLSKLLDVKASIPVVQLVQEAA